MSDLAPLQSPRLAALPGVRHAFFTRQGGFSRGLYASLNAGRGSDDNPLAVEKNRQTMMDWFRPQIGAMAWIYQIHSATAHAVTQFAGEITEPRQGDGLVTALPAMACSILTADCAPVLIADAEARVVGAAHAGWRGALDGIIASTVTAMEGLGARPERMVAVIGPCIAPASYEVGLEFLERFTAEAPGSECFFQPGLKADKRQFDLPGFVLHRLAQSGVTNAEWIGRDTCAEEEIFFSNRRAVLRGEADYGRLLSAIMLIG